MRAVAVAVALLAGVSACSGTDKAGGVEAAVGQLASPGPGGEARGAIEYLDCGDRAEMPMASANFEVDDAPDSSDVDAANAWLEQVTEHYLTVWRDQGWSVEEGGAVKTVEGIRVRAGVDAWGDRGYSVIAVEDDGGLCDHSG